jgi:hypothetical protein
MVAGRLLMEDFAARHTAKAIEKATLIDGSIATYIAEVVQPLRTWDAQHAFSRHQGLFISASMHGCGRCMTLFVLSSR